MRSALFTKLCLFETRGCSEMICENICLQIEIRTAMHQVVRRIRAELKRNVDNSTNRSFQRFFKEEVKYYGVKTGTVGKIANKFWKEVEASDKSEIFSLCEELYSSGYCKEALLFHIGFRSWLTD